MILERMDLWKAPILCPSKFEIYFVDFFQAESDSSSVSSQLRDDTTSLVDNSAAIPTSPPSGQAPPADYSNFCYFGFDKFPYFF